MDPGPATSSSCRGCRKIKDDEDARNAIDNGSGEAAMSSATIRPAAIRSPIVGQPAPHTAPNPIHSLRHGSSVLALAVSSDSIFAGTQDGEIVVWSLGTFEETNRVQAHKRSVLCLFLSDDSPLLFSSGSDPIVNVWCPSTLSRLYEVYSTYDSFGDIFSVAYSPQHETAYFGAQNTTIQWVSLRDPGRHAPLDSASHPDRRNHRFFDSRAAGGTSTPRPLDDRHDLIPRPQTVLETDRRANRLYAHFGYVYCMLLARGPTAYVDPDEEVLISGGGDGTIKMWKLGGTEIGPDGVENGIDPIMVLGEDDAESVMSLAVDETFLYGGKLDGIVELWDLDTRQRLRVIKAPAGDVMTLHMGWGFLWSAGTTGTASKHSTVHYGEYQTDVSQNASQKYQCLMQWQAHDGKVLASAVAEHRGIQLYITGANDRSVGVWMVQNQTASEQEEPVEDGEGMIACLREFVSFKTVSSRPEFSEDCRRGATFLRTLFRRLGGDVEMLSSGDGLHHPVVFARFGGKFEPAEKRKRILFYGHYDVVPADSKKNRWNTDPFQLTGINGYLYGRGVSDNKGPVMAALFAVADLVQARSLDSDVVFLIEGEEESGSRGFKETVRQHRDRIGPVDYILLANSYWLNDETPCLTHGLRGVLHATVCVESKQPDLHSGVDGSYMVDEPMTDLTTLVSKLKAPRNRIMVPGFYDGLPALKPDEEARYDDIASVLMEQDPANGSAAALKASLVARWREPNLTIHRFKVSGPDGSLISSHASANISFRLVPGQEVERVATSLISFLESEFASLESSNSLSIQIDNKAEPWLGDPDNEIFRTLESAIMEVWAPLFSHDEPAPEGEPKAAVARKKPSKPLYIREGGSIPAIRFLEKEFNAPAAHLPCGQASDSAHLGNERLRLLNLLKSREIFSIVFEKLS